MAMEIDNHRETFFPCNSSGPSPQACPPHGLLGKVVARSPVLGCPHSPQSMVSSSSGSLVGPVIRLSGGANLCASPCRGIRHRCFQPGLGRTQGPPVSSSPPAPSPVFLSHHPSRSGGSLPGASTVSSLNPWTTCSSEYRQHDSGLPYHSQGTAGALSSPSPSLGCMVSPSSASVCNYVLPQTSNLHSAAPDPTACAVDALSIP